MKLKSADGTSAMVPYDTIIHTFDGKLAKQKWSVQFYVDSMSTLYGSLYARTWVTVFYTY